MTEAEWLVCDDPSPMLDFLRGRVSERKMRLAACTALRRFASLVPGVWFESAIQVAEVYADTGIVSQEVSVAQSQATTAFADLLEHYFPDGRLFLSRAFYGGALTAVQTLRMLLFGGDRWSVPANLQWCAKAAFPLSEPIASDVDAGGAKYAAVRAEESTYPALIRELVGNPFRPATFAPEWRTDTVVALATQMYESRCFDVMPILADALQDAGCDSDNVLNHCRGAGPHVRGCFVLDLVLGKT